MGRKTLSPLLVLFAALLGFHPALAADHEGHHGRGGGPGRAIPADEAGRRDYFTDLPLLTQDGRPVRFYSDILKDKVVLISFIFTNCDEACPLLMRSFREVQDLLGDRVGRDVFLVSISVDPEADTPDALKEYGERYGAGAGWVFLTGK